MQSCGEVAAGSSYDTAASQPTAVVAPFCSAGGLDKATVELFSRQIIVSGIGAEGMRRIQQARVLCVGCGGLGSTAALYLAAAGVGELTLVDGDTVEAGNLHRQVIHTRARVGENKAASARAACLALNPSAEVRAVEEMLTCANAAALVRACDVVVDGSDNVAARYLVGDAAAACGKPLVSASAVRWEGQLSVYGYRGGPCYRCLFPIPPPAEAVGSCSDVGVVGPVPGMMGCLEALEALKVVAGAGTTLSQRMFVFDGLRFSARVVTLRERQTDCIACGGGGGGGVLSPARAEYQPTGCGSGLAASQRLGDAHNCTPAFFAEQMFGRRAAGSSGGGGGGDWCCCCCCHCIDVRAEIQYKMAHLPGTVNVPLLVLRRWAAEGSLRAQLDATFLCTCGPCEGAGRTRLLFVICRRGIASVKATELIVETLGVDSAGSSDGAPTTNGETRVFNVVGGLNAYHREVDASFPFY